MKYCPNCKVDIYTERITCPLCRTNLEDKEVKKNDIIYQPYPKFKEREKRRHLFFKILVFLSIIGMIIVGVINYLTFDNNNPSYWSLIVIVGIMVLWFFGRGMFVSKGNFGRRLSLLNLSCLILLLVIEFDFSNQSWVLNYILPFLIMSEISCLSLMSLISSKQYRKLIACLFMLVLVSFIPLIFLKFGIVKINWPSISCCLLGIIVFLGMIIFGFRITLEQLKKYFHV